MKKELNIFLLVFLLAIALILLGLYYTQPFVSNFNFKDKIALKDVDVQKNLDSYSNAFTLTSAKAEVGTLTLKNDGYFTQLYTFPRTVGCIELKDSVDPNRVTLKQTEFAVNYQGDGTIYYNGQETEISSGSSRNFVLKAEYTPYNIPLSQFTNDNIKGISIYVLKDKEDNPIYLDNYVNNGYYSDECETLKKKNSADAFIYIN